MAARRAVAAATTTSFQIGNTQIWGPGILRYQLCKVYGIGQSRANSLCAQMGLNPLTRVEHLGDNWNHVKHMVETTIPTKQDILKKVGDDIMHKINIGCYQGVRHQLLLPVHGQNARNNGQVARKLAKQRAQLFNIPLLAKKAGRIPTVNQPAKAEVQRGRPKADDSDEVVYTSEYETPLEELDLENKGKGSGRGPT